MNRVLAVVFVSLVALAGCTGAPPGGPGTQTATPPPLEEVQFPNGTADDGIEAGVLTDTHQRTLQAAGTFAVTTSQLQRTARGSVEQSVAARIDAERNAFSGRTAQGNRRSDFYASNGTGFTRQRGEGGDSYGRITAEASAEAITDQLAVRPIQGALQQLRFRATGTDRLGGEVVIRFESTGLNTSPNGTDPASSLDPNSSATLAVSESGVVKAADVRLIRKSGGATNLSVRISEVGSATVERPDWVDSAESETTPVPTTPEVSISATQTNATLETAAGTVTAPVVTFQHEGGQAVTRSTLQVRVVTEGRPVPGYDVTALSAPGGRLESTAPLAGNGSIVAGDSIRVVHTVPQQYHDSIRLDPAAGTLTAGNGTVTDGRLSSGDQVLLIWSGGQRSSVLASYQVT
jgi:hypothetical protein